MVVFKRKKRDISYLSSGYVEQHKSNRVIKWKKFNITTDNVCGLITDVTRELLNQDLHKSGVENFPFMKKLETL